jgi:phosphatidate cytidylyltransferase
MNEAARERLFGMAHALDHPVTRWVLIGAGALLVVAPVFIALLSMRSDSEKRREMWLRYRSWVILAPLMAGPILLGAAATIAAVCILSILCYREFARATGLFRETLTSAMVVLGILAVTFAVADHWYGLFLALAPLGIMLIAAANILPDQPKGYIQRVGLGALAFMLFGSGLGHLGYFANDELYRPILLMIIATVELNDIIAFCFGKLLGRRKLAPSTSPNKTVAGSIASVLLTSPLVAFLCHYLFIGTSIDQPIPLTALGLTVSIGGQLGDLMLSSVKRDIGVKDLGVTIPGHGGLLDRFNSLLLVAPAMFHLIGYFRGIGLDGPTRIFSSHPPL